MNSSQTDQTVPQLQTDLSIPNQGVDATIEEFQTLQRVSNISRSIAQLQALDLALTEQIILYQYRNIGICQALYPQVFEFHNRRIRDLKQRKRLLKQGINRLFNDLTAIETRLRNLANGHTE